MGGIEIRTRRTLLPGQCARKGVSSLPVRHCELPSRRPRNLPGASRQRLEDRPYGTYPVIGGASMSFDCGHKLTSLRCNCVDYQRRNDGMAPNGGRCRADRGTESANAHLRWRRANWYLGESQRSLQRTGHDDRVHPSSKPLGVPAWQVQY